MELGQIKFNMEITGSTIIIQFRPLADNYDEASEAANRLFIAIENAAHAALNQHIVEISQKN